MAEDEQGVSITFLPARIGTRDDCSLSQGEVRMGGDRLLLVFVLFLIMLFSLPYPS